MSLSSLPHSALNAATSSFASCLLFFFLGSPASSTDAFLFSPTKMEKGFLGGSAGASLRNFRVMTFMASVIISLFIFSSVFLNSLKVVPSLKSFTSSLYFCFNSASFSLYFCFASSSISSNLFFTNFMPLPSPLPAGTSSLMSSRKRAYTLFGFFGIVLRFTRRFSLFFTTTRFCRNLTYDFWRLNSTIFLRNSSFRAFASFSKGARSSGEVFFHFSPRALLNSPALAPFFSSCTCFMYLFLKRLKALAGFGGASLYVVRCSLFSACLPSILAFLVWNSFQSSVILYSANFT
mmetsp:Transcript_96088/g.228840  ORF Transcript_96088/g.228840 Transcript_96088/m.228840 type:complete len:292 (+) Transcript_96088:2163-3038(+)